MQHAVCYSQTFADTVQGFGEIKMDREGDGDESLDGT
jgi:hypothetical protein